MNPIGRSPGILLAALLAAPLAAQDARAQRYQGGVFALEIPGDWRELGPGEALGLADSLPIDMREISPGQVFALGPVDRWLAEGRFSGEALLVVAQRFERPTDEQELDEIRSFWKDWHGPDGSRREVLGAHVGEIGPDRHPVIALEMRLVPGSGAPPLHTLDYYASTMGQQLILSFRAWENDWQESEPKLRRMAESLTFARPPRKPPELSDTILPWAGLGAMVGIGLVIARRLIRRRSALSQ